MLEGIRNYFYERRKGLGTTAGVVGGLYLLGNYALERLEEIRDQHAQSQKDRDK